MAHDWNATCYLRHVIQPTNNLLLLWYANGNHVFFCRVVHVVISTMSSKYLPDNKQFNISFVKTVEKYPCLYNSTLKSYTRKEQDKTWKEIAVMYSSTGVECKKRWKILRGSLTRYIKQSTEKSECVVKKYYLWDVMHFVLPFTKSRSHLDNLPNIKDEIFENDDSNVDEDEESILYDTEAPADYSPQADFDNSNFSCTPSSSSRLSIKKEMSPKARNEDEMGTAGIDYLSQENVRKARNSDMDFFKSILPDVGTLNSSQKRRFKIIVLQTLEDMIQETNVSSNVPSLLNDRPANSSSLQFSDAASTTSHVYKYTSNDIAPIQSSGTLIQESTYPLNYQSNQLRNENDS